MTCPVRFIWRQNIVSAQVFPFTAPTKALRKPGARTFSPSLTTCLARRECLQLSDVETLRFRAVGEEVELQVHRWRARRSGPGRLTTGQRWFLSTF